MPSSPSTEPEVPVTGDILHELQRLKAEHARLRTMVEHSYDLVYLMNENGTVLFTNPSTLHYGFAPEEVIGHQCFRLGSSR
jgi:PAS domain-containing protein